MDGQTLFKLSCIQDGRTLYCRKQLHPWFLQVNEIIFDLSPSNLGSFERLQRGACDWPFQNCRICLPSRNVLERPRGRSVVWQACMCWNYVSGLPSAISVGLRALHFLRCDTSIVNGRARVDLVLLMDPFSFSDPLFGCLRSYAQDFVRPPSLPPLFMDERFQCDDVREGLRQVNHAFQSMILQSKGFAIEARIHLVQFTDAYASMLLHQNDEAFPQRICIGCSSHHGVPRSTSRIRARQGSQQFPGVFHAVIVGESQGGSMCETILFQENAQGGFASLFVQQSEESFLHDCTCISQEVSPSPFPRRMRRRTFLLPPFLSFRVWFVVGFRSFPFSFASRSCRDAFVRIPGRFHPPRIRPDVLRVFLRNATAPDTVHDARLVQEPRPVRLQRASAAASPPPRDARARFLNPCRSARPPSSLLRPERTSTRACVHAKRLDVHATSSSSSSSRVAPGPSSPPRPYPWKNSDTVTADIRAPVRRWRRRRCATRCGLRTLVSRRFSGRREGQEVGSKVGGGRKASDGAKLRKEREREVRRSSEVHCRRGQGMDARAHRAERGRVEATRRQLDELDALRATWPEAGAVVLCREEEAVVDALRRHVQEHEDEARQEAVHVAREAPATLSYVVSPPDCRGATFVVSLPCTYPLQGRPTIRVDVPSAARARIAHLQHVVDACVSAWPGCECVHAAVAAVQDAMDDASPRVEVEAPVSSEAEAESDEESTCSIRALWFHHVRARGKRNAMAEWAEELHVCGWCVVGRPGALVALGRRDDATTFVHRVKRLRWQSVAERHAEDQVVRGVGVDVQHLPVGWTEIHGERGFAQLAERCRRAGLERVVQALVRHDA